MTLNNYRLASPSTVILIDERDPYVSWRHHQERRGMDRGGVDIVAAVGTPVIARTAGTMRRIPNNGDAGNSCNFQHDSNPGWSDVFSHLSSYVGVDGQHFNAGEIVAFTGDTGNVAPHLHWHLVDRAGVRQNPWDHFSPATPPSNAKQKEDNAMFAIEQNRTPGTPDTGSIAVYGGGNWIQIAPGSRGVYTAFRNVHNKQVDAGYAYYKLPELPVSVDQNEWNGVKIVMTKALA